MIQTVRTGDIYSEETRYAHVQKAETSAWTWQQDNPELVPELRLFWTSSAAEAEQIEQPQEKTGCWAPWGARLCTPETPRSHKGIKRNPQSHKHFFHF